MTIADYLDLNMPGVLQVFFEIAVGTTEKGIGLCCNFLHGGFKRRWRLDNDNTPTTTTVTGFEQHRVTDLSCDLMRIINIAEPASAAGQNRDTLFCQPAPRPGLVSHQLDVPRCGANKVEAPLFHRSGEGSIFRQQTIAGVHRIAVQRHCRCQ